MLHFKIFLMKQILVGLSILILVSALVSFADTGENKNSLPQNFLDTVDPRKEYPVKMQVVNWDKYYQGLSIAANELRQSDRPSKNVAFVIDSVIFPLQQQILMQLQKQFAETDKKPK